jgi:hypothetical protein
MGTLCRVCPIFCLTIGVHAMVLDRNGTEGLAGAVSWDLWRTLAGSSPQAAKGLICRRALELVQAHKYNLAYLPVLQPIVAF